jgi:hypothetical protein
MKKNKDARVLVRLTKEEKALLQYEASKQGVSVSQLIRNLSILKQ